MVAEPDVGARLYVAEFMISLRTFFSGWKTIIYILGTKRQRRATDALRLIDIHNVVICIWNASSVPKYIGTNASQIMHVVYMENPMNFDSLKFSGMFLVFTAYTVHMMMRSILYINETRKEISRVLHLRITSFLLLYGK